MPDSPLSQTEMSRIKVHYHQEDDGWWGEAIESGWRVSVASPTLGEAREQMGELLPFAVDERLVARSLMFVHWHKTPLVTFNPDAAEVFVLEARS